ncbi:probable serine/threonine-protein kinase irlF isoform X1 [Bactrocera neohumeralis]|uniref:probable serine/threonine-protein kinase irlF isoform X1 n=1 Tax=Bactrocera neohumeralis TaxID=98809 RepID=UPI001A958822|nr:probable serine/threonine-protein kinase irlF [Bactrocera tryoni]XP_050316817.1 probable serine/threonine-protein kinase irlF isoform X1 [Bactrocera neohumeralis]
MRPEIKSFHRKQLPAFPLMLLSLMLFGFTSAQRVAPGVPPQHYQQVPVQHNQQPQYQQQQQQQIHHAPNVNPQHYQQQVQYQQVPVQQQQQQQYQQQQQPQFQQQQPPQQQQQFQQQPPQPVQQQAPHAPHQAHHGQQQVLNAANIQDERAHIQEHMQVPIDTSKMSEAELQFHYFKMHDSDNNNKLDGCELIKSLIHWHEQGSKEQPHNEQTPHVEEKIFSDEELVALIDPILQMDDTSRDGYIDYPEFIKAQQKAVAASQQKQQQQQQQQQQQPQSGK